MTIYNCNPFNGNYVRCGSFGPACGTSGSSSCGCNSCNSCGSCNSCNSCGCGNSCSPCGCGNWGCSCGCGSCGHCCGCGCGNNNFIPTPEVPFPCASCGEESSACSVCSELRSQIDNIQYTVNEIYRLIAPVPYSYSENYTA